MDWWKRYLQAVYERLEQFDGYDQLDLVMAEVCEGDPGRVDHLKRLIAKHRREGGYPRRWVEKAIEAL